tara:strand:+ start:336 stop:1061 length:726 start_codon:yes stop_codon:yes gene_type:complete
MILITRPKAEANKLFHELKAIGISSHVDSLSSISTKRKKILVKKNHAVLISSPRAARIFSSSKLSKKVPLLIIGKVSEGLLIKANFKNVIKTLQDSVSLINYLKRNKKSFTDENMLNGIDHKTGNVSNLFMKKKIAALGIQFHEDIIYKTTFKKKLKDQTIKLIKSGSIKFVLVYSQENARVLIKLMNSKNIKKNSKNIKFICLSKQIAQIIKQNGFISFNPSRPSQTMIIKLILSLSVST